MASVGPNYPGTGASLANAGTSENANAWTNPGNIGSSSAVASITAATFDSPDISEILVASNFGFNIGAADVVTGITVEISKRGYTSANSGKDYRVQLAKGTAFANLVGDNKASASVWPQTTLATTTYGGTTDGWNAGLKGADVNSSTFAVFLSAYANVANADIDVDWIRVTLTYTPVTVVSSSFSANAAIKKAVSSSFSANAVIKANSGTKTFTADAATWKTTATYWDDFNRTRSGSLGTSPDGTSWTNDTEVTWNVNGAAYSTFNNSGIYQLGGPTFSHADIRDVRVRSLVSFSVNPTTGAHWFHMHVRNQNPTLNNVLAAAFRLWTNGDIDARMDTRNNGDADWTWNTVAPANVATWSDLTTEKWWFEVDIREAEVELRVWKDGTSRPSTPSNSGTLASPYSGSGKTGIRCGSANTVNTTLSIWQWEVWSLPSFTANAVLKKNSGTKTFTADAVIWGTTANYWDNFAGRTTTGSLGTSSDGNDWINDASGHINCSMNVESGAAYIPFTATGGNSNTAMAMDHSVVLNQRARALFRTSDLTGDVYYHINARYHTTGGANWRGVQVRVNPDGSVDAQCQGKDNAVWAWGGWTNGLLTGLTVSDGLWVEVIMTGAQPYTLEIRLWKDGTSRPETATLSESASVTSREYAGKSGWWVGNDTSLPTIYCDQFEVWQVSSTTTVSGSFSANAVLKKTISGSFSANAIIKKAIVKTSYDTAVKALTPTSYWRLGETSGSAIDERGVQNGSYIGSPTLGVAGFTNDGNKAVTLNGTSQYVSMADNAAWDVGTSDFSMSVIVDLTAWPSGATGNGFLIGRGNGSGAGDYSLDFDWDWANHLFLYITNTAYYFDIGFNPAGTGPRHYLITVDRDAVATLYIDGVALGGAQDVSAQSATNIASGRTFQVGATHEPWAYVTGTMDEAVFWNGTALSAEQVAVLYAAISGVGIVANAAIKKTISGSFSADAVIKASSGTKTFTADADIWGTDANYWDNFAGRSTSSDLGTSPDGNNWGTNDADWSVTGGYAYAASVSSSLTAYRPGPVFPSSTSLKNVRVRALVNFSRNSVEGNSTLNLIVRNNGLSGTSSKYYRCLFQFRTNNTVYLLVQGTKSGNWNAIAGGTLAAYYQSGTWTDMTTQKWWIEFDAKGGTHTTDFEVRVWLDGDSRPSTATATGYDTDTELDISGKTGFFWGTANTTSTNVYIYSWEVWTLGVTTVPGSFTSDAAIKKTGLPGSFTANAIVKKTDLQGSFTAASILRKPSETQFTASADVKGAVGSSLSSNAVIKKTGIPGSLTAAAILRVTQPGSATAAAVIKRTGTTNTFSAAAVVKAGSGTKTFTAGAAIRFAQSSSFTAASDIKRTMSASLSANAAIKAPVPSSLSANAVVKKTSSTQTFTSDAVIKRQQTGSATASSVIKRTQAGSFPVDARLMPFFTADAWVANPVLGSFSAAAAIKKTLSGSLTAAAVLKVVQPGSFTEAAIIKQVQSTSLTAAADIKSAIASFFSAAAIARKTSSPSFTAAAVFKTTSGTQTFTANAVVKRVQTGTPTASAVIKRTMPGSATADAVFKRGMTGTPFDAAAMLAIQRTGSLSSNAISKRTQTGSLASDAVVKRSQAGSLTAASDIKATVSSSLTASSVIKQAQSGSFTASAISKRTMAGSLSADAIAKRAMGQSFGADAVIKAAIPRSATADAVVMGSASDSFVIEALTNRVAKCIWTTPGDTVQIDSTETLHFLMPVAATSNMHFEIQVDTEAGFTDPIVYLSSHLTGWEYWDGGAWQPIPQDGVPNTFCGNEARYTIQVPLENGTYYRRVRAGVI